MNNANFKPEQSSYKEVKPFRAWCQKVLPLVYDDSLSYYELLCKVLNVLNETLINVDNIHGDSTNLFKAYEELENYVNNYFDNLDVSDEINDKLDEYVEDGTLTRLLLPYITSYQNPIIVSSTDLMTDKDKIYVLSTDGHIYQWVNGSFVDTGFVYGSVNNAITAYGVNITSENYTDLLPNLDEASLNKIYAINNVGNLIENYPSVNNSGTLLTFTQQVNRETQPNKSWEVQLLVDSTNNMYYRSCWAGNWSSWFNVPLSNNVITSIQDSITPSTYSEKLPDLNNAQVNKIYSINNCLRNISNSPSGIGLSGVLLVFQAANTIFNNLSFTVQMLFDILGNTWVRSCWGGSWSEWNNNRGIIPSVLYTIYANKIVDSNNYQTKLPDFNTASINKIYTINGALNLINNKPPITQTSGSLLTLNADPDRENISNKSFSWQLFMGQNGILYYRSCWNGNWSEWVEVLGTNNARYSYVPFNLSQKYYVATCVDKTKIKLNEDTKILIFGDSIAHGADGGNWTNDLKNIVGCTVNNKAVGGALFGHSGRDSSYWISTQLENTTEEEWQNANLIIIAGGTNDAAYTADMAELKTEVQNVINTVASKTTNPVLVITPIRRGDSDTNVNNSKLPYISGIIENVSLMKKYSVINGFDFPIPPYTEGLIDSMMVSNIHPNAIGGYVYAMSVINAVI